MMDQIIQGLSHEGKPEGFLGLASVLGWLFTIESTIRFGDDTPTRGISVLSLGSPE